MPTGRSDTRRCHAGLAAAVAVGLLAIVPGLPVTSTDAAEPTLAVDVSSSPATYALGRFPDVPDQPVPGATAKAMQAVLDAAVERGLPGVTASVLSPDAGAWSGAAGTADGINPVEVGSQFAIASITKTVIATAILRLVEAGRLHLDDPVSEHLPPAFRFDTNGATIRDLLAMESGIPDPALSATAPEVLADPSRAWTAEEVLASVPAHRSPPGDHFVYEDANYMLLGLVLEATTGKSVAEALRSHVLADPRISALVYQPAERPNGPLALPHIRGQLSADFEAGGGYLPNRSQASNGSGSGGMASDAPALATWGYLLFGGRLLSESSLAMMTDFGAGAEYDRFGLGVFDQTDLAAGYGVPAIGNGGWDDGGYSSVLTVLPGQATVIVVLTNTAGSPVDLVVPIAQELAALLPE